MTRLGEAQVIPLPRRELDGPPVTVPRPRPVTRLRQRREAPGLRAFVRNRLTGEYPVDEFGFDPELTDTLLLPPLRAVYEKWFRVTVTGTLPPGGSLVVANHSGTLPWDALMTAVAVRDNHPERRHLRMLGADLVFKVPVLGSLARKSGQTLACRADAVRLLRAGEVVGVWPEGFKGIGKPFHERYRLQRFGRGGFVTTALRAEVPIVPCSIVGAEEIHPKIADLKPLAKLLGLPYFPVTPLFPLLGPLGAIPLPTKWHIHFGDPIRPAPSTPDAADDPAQILEIADTVRDTIQATLDHLVATRPSIF
ncbi:lysophospholipid acyltransferase family protein [Actinophytocola gossypii]|uniref:Acyltransferase family protein n=1 Tax=Actinophytocola gossypii TaxID=2812003 RepID=A0ABT2JCS0_9PSEU|nr:lysophospholipid acyltransferase family protein [Actinophytocola gossypii]MCT2585673.1 acyltransferase family protein [Actinophytocola gossypii]